ncbi:MAG: hypothetical protein WA414_00280 [Acidobacteriaceae bacterium]
MSRLKSPQEKKTASLDLDRRNAYGENAKASRKGIPRSKKRSHSAERQAAARWQSFVALSTKIMPFRLRLNRTRIRRRRSTRVSASIQIGHCEMR